MYSERALSRKPFRIGHMYIHIFLLTLTDSTRMTSQNNELSCWETLCNMYRSMKVVEIRQQHKANSVTGDTGITTH
jgi:hypothetical protein